MEERMDLRISTVESDVASVRASVEAIHSNYATNIALVEAENRLHLEIIQSRNELDRKIDNVAADLKLEFHKVANDTRNWMLATAIGLFVAFGGMFFGLLKFLKP
jgi:hypothetical protein